jgi:hypothetical protein
MTVVEGDVKVVGVEFAGVRGEANIPPEELVALHQEKSQRREKVKEETA